ncbi:carbohydrate kinase family protein [Psittacicella hinzii]|uniref:Carbohydrate kinase PfkB domain-containing protein n=1 Tax=Psittacicella hinzii TaxID=2028575 RepID=A0A3A1YS47_9GAMM|nr:PfkB family carbohydrate kinase [Psittacicella hinzii]RIY40316.1 hypothetical protein CKF58_00695 [Psittacicella hinzii]
MAIVCIGLTVGDLLFYTPQAPEKNHKSYAHKLLKSGGGPAGNAAYVTSKWQAPTYVLSTLGQDFLASDLIVEYQEIGIDTNYILQSPDFITPTASVVICGTNGSRTIVTYKNVTDERELTATDFAKLDELIAQLNAQEQEHIVLVDGHELILSEYVITRLQRKRVIMDAGSTKQALYKLLPLTNYAVCSEDFSLGVLGLKTDKFPLASYRLALDMVASLAAPEATVVITLGEHGGIYRTPVTLSNAVQSLTNNNIAHSDNLTAENNLVAQNGLAAQDSLATKENLNSKEAYYGKFSAQKVEVVDTTGAGDIFHGAFAYGLEAGWDLQRCISVAATTSALKITQQGVRNAIPELAEVEDYLAEHPLEFSALQL